MQRLFSTFPGGRPGVGLLLLRSAVGVALGVEGIVWLAGRSSETWVWAAGPLALATGALLLMGFLTPVASLFAALGCTGAAWMELPSSLATVCAPAPLFLAVMAVAVFLLGPGAYSLDSRWFGRREVVIPPSPGRPYK